MKIEIHLGRSKKWFMNILMDTPLAINSEICIIRQEIDDRSLEWLMTHILEPKEKSDHFTGVLVKKEVNGEIITYTITQEWIKTN